MAKGSAFGRKPKNLKLFYLGLKITDHAIII